jgi:hypothetical protein
MAAPFNASIGGGGWVGLGDWLKIIFSMYCLQQSIKSDEM